MSRSTRSQWLTKFCRRTFDNTTKEYRPRPEKHCWLIEDKGKITEVAAATKSGARWKYKGMFNLKKFPLHARIYRKPTSKAS